MRGEGQLRHVRRGAGVRRELIERVKTDVAQILQKLELDLEEVREQKKCRIS